MGSLRSRRRGAFLVCAWPRSGPPGSPSLAALCRAGFVGAYLCALPARPGPRFRCMDRWFLSRNTGPDWLHLPGCFHPLYTVSALVVGPSGVDGGAHCVLWILDRASRAAARSALSVAFRLGCDGLNHDGRGGYIVHLPGAASLAFARTAHAVGVRLRRCDACLRMAAYSARHFEDSRHS